MPVVSRGNGAGDAQRRARAVQFDPHERRPDGRGVHGSGRVTDVREPDASLRYGGGQNEGIVSGRRGSVNYEVGRKRASSAEI